MSDKCPDCGSEMCWREESAIRFACGQARSSPERPEIIDIFETHACYKRQLAQAGNRAAGERGRADREIGRAEGQRDREKGRADTTAVHLAVLRKILEYVHFVLTEGGPVDGDLGNSVQLAADRIRARAEKAEAVLKAAHFCEAHEPIPAQPETGCPMCEAVHQADLRKKAEAERNELFFALDELQCDIASALGWDCHGIVFHRLVRGYVMAHEMERAEVERLRERQKDDEGLIQRAIEALSTGIALPCRDATIAEMGLVMDALRARLGEAAQGVPERHISKAGQEQLDALADAKRKGLASWIEDGAVKTAPKVGGKHFGRHWYEEDGTSDCKHGCGCWMGPCRSGGPVDPFGPCPNNPQLAQGEEADDGEAKG